MSNIAYRFEGFDIASPISAPIAAAATGGVMASGNYQYTITYVTAFGETTGSAVSISANTTTGAMALSAVPISPDGDVIARRIYRTAVGNTNPYRYVGVIADNITTVYTDLLNDTSLGANAPLGNFASSEQQGAGWVGFSKPIVSSASVGVVAAGITQATATPLIAEYNYITVGTNLFGVSLPGTKLSLVGQRVKVINTSVVNTLSVYPALATDQIDALGAGIAFIMSANSSCEFIATGAAQWNHTLPGATASSGGSVGSFAEFYSTEPSDNPGTIALGNPISFPSAGPTNAGSITQTAPAAFQLAAIGTYEVSYEVAVTEAAQLAIYLNAVKLARTEVGRSGTGTIISSRQLITTVAANTILAVYNSGSAGAITITVNAGGTNPVHASITIKQIA